MLTLYELADYTDITIISFSVLMISEDEHITLVLLYITYVEIQYTTGKNI